MTKLESFLNRVSRSVFFFAWFENGKEMMGYSKRFEREERTFGSDSVFEVKGNESD